MSKKQIQFRCPACHTQTAIITKQKAKPLQPIRRAFTCKHCEASFAVSFHRDPKLYWQYKIEFTLKGITAKTKHIIETNEALKELANGQSDDHDRGHAERKSEGGVQTESGADAGPAR